MISLDSTPYAQRFCTAVAQTLLGTKARFSIHTKFLFAHRTTKSVQASPAHTLICTFSLS